MAGKPKRDGSGPRPTDVEKVNGLDPEERILSRRERIAVTSFGRKVVLGPGGLVEQRLSGPPYSWEA